MDASSLCVEGGAVIRIEVEMLGHLRKYLAQGNQKATFDVPEGATVGDLLAQLGIQNDEAWNVSIEGKLVDQNHRLKEGTRILVFPPIAGG